MDSTGELCPPEPGTWAALEPLESPYSASCSADSGSEGSLLRAFFRFLGCGGELIGLDQVQISLLYLCDIGQHNPSVCVAALTHNDMRMGR